ncbi:hypothetical protein MBANPS3_008526, partial [Mucor bainieri]
TTEMNLIQHFMPLNSRIQLTRLLSLKLECSYDDDMYFYAAKDKFSLIMEPEELEGLEFDKTGPKSLLSTLRNCFKNGIGLRKYSLSDEDMGDVIEIAFKNETDQAKALTQRTRIRGRDIRVRKPLVGDRAHRHYRVDIFDLPFNGDCERMERVLVNSFIEFGVLYAYNVHETEDGSWMTGTAHVVMVANGSHDDKLGKYTSMTLADCSRVRVKWSKGLVYFPAKDE